MEDKPLVSILTIACNREKYIAEAIESVLACNKHDVNCFSVEISMKSISTHKGMTIWMFSYAEPFGVHLTKI